MFLLTIGTQVLADAIPEPALAVTNQGSEHEVCPHFTAQMEKIEQLDRQYHQYTQREGPKPDIEEIKTIIESLAGPSPLDQLDQNLKIHRFIGNQ